MFSAEGALAAIAISAVLNIVATLSHRSGARLGDREARLYLAYDMLQLARAAVHHRRAAESLRHPDAGAGDGVRHHPVALERDRALGGHRPGAVASSRSSICRCRRGRARRSSRRRFTCSACGRRSSPRRCSSPATSGSVAEEARRMRDAFAATQLALAREQRISAVGGLAAAAAHQLGSPLATIALVTKELVRDLPPDSPYAEDAAAAAEPERALPHHPRRAGAAARRRGRGPFRAAAGLGAGRGGGRAAPPRRHRAQLRARARPYGGGQPMAEPRVAPSPEIMHGLGNLIQNAVQFAHQRGRGHDELERRDGARSISSMTVRASRSRCWRGIGEPYISGRGGESAAYGARHLHRAKAAGAHRRAARLRQSRRGRRPRSWWNGAAGALAAHEARPSKEVAA